MVHPVFGNAFYSFFLQKNGCSAPAVGSYASVAETAYLQNYLTANAITASGIHGMFYVIHSPGSGASPNLCSNVRVTYTGRLITGTTDGAQFDASLTPVNFSLDGLIAGWQPVLPLLKSNGTVTLYIPPSLGYGAQVTGSGANTIPANSYLKFDITLLSTD